MAGRGILIVAALVMGVLSARADTIYDNGGPTTFPIGWISDTRFQVAADDFTLSDGANVVSDIHWWGSYQTLTPAGYGNASPWDDDFSIYIYTGDAWPSTSPVQSLTSLAVTRTATSLVNTSNQNIFAYSVQLGSPLTLAANTKYWISIVNTHNQVDDWVWSNVDGGGSTVISLQRPNSPHSWLSVGRGMAFNLTNDGVSSPIPEPATLSLLGMGLIGLAARARRKKS